MGEGDGGGGGGLEYELVIFIRSSDVIWGEGGVGEREVEMRGR